MINAADSRALAGSYGRFHTATGADHCSGSAEPGTVHLQTALLEAYGPRGAVSAGIYACRESTGGSGLSVHSEGRALDLMVGAGGQELGNDLLYVLLSSAWALGLQRIIWWRTQYDYSAPGGVPYGPYHPHEDHLHIEQTRYAARLITYDEVIAALVIPGLEKIVQQLLVQHGTGVWVVAGDLSSRTRVGSTADQLALQATGQYRVVKLSDAQMDQVPIAGALSGGRL